MARACDITAEQRPEQRQTDGWTGEWVDRRAAGRPDGWTDGRTSVSGNGPSPAQRLRVVGAAATHGDATLHGTVPGTFDPTSSGVYSSIWLFVRQLAVVLPVTFSLSSFSSHGFRAHISLCPCVVASWDRTQGRSDVHQLIDRDLVGWPICLRGFGRLRAILTCERPRVWPTHRCTSGVP